jgi:sugar lactone lactonase YvrE
LGLRAIPAAVAASDQTSQLHHADDNFNQDLLLVDNQACQVLRIRMGVVGAGSVQLVAGNGVCSGGCPDGGSAVATCLDNPADVIVDAAGNVIISETRANRIRIVWASNATVGTLVSSGTNNNVWANESGGKAEGSTEVQVGTLPLAAPMQMALDARGGVLYFVDSGNFIVRALSLADKRLSTVAGSGNGTYCCDGGPATEAGMLPNGVALFMSDGGGWLFISDSNANRIRVVSLSTGIINTLAGNGHGGSLYECPNGSPPNRPCVTEPGFLQYDAATDGLYYVSQEASSLLLPVMVVRVVGPVTPLLAALFGPAARPAYSESSAVPVINTLTPGFKDMYYCGDGGPATTACVSLPQAVIPYCPQDDYYYAAAAQYTGGDGCSNAIGRGAACGDGSGSVLMTDLGDHAVRFIDGSTGIITTLIGNGYAGACVSAVSPGPAPATGACLDEPVGLAAVPNGFGAFWVSDATAGAIYLHVPPTGTQSNGTGTVTLVAGGGSHAADGSCATLGDGAPALRSCLNVPTALAADSVGNLLIADTENNRVRVVWAANDTISTLAGGGNASAFCGDGGPAAEACLLRPLGVAVDPLTDNVAIADTGNFRVRLASHATGTITTVAGNGTQGNCGDGGAATGACVVPYAVNFMPRTDGNGSDLLIGSAGLVRRVNSQTGVITTIAGECQCLEDNPDDINCGDNGEFNRVHI